MLITAGVHGDEFEPMEACRRIYQKLKSQHNQIQGRITLVPVVNYPAFMMASRTGDDQLDLARSCPGDADGSTTEKIARELSNLIQTSDYYVDLHNGGRLFDIYPYAGYMLHSDRSILHVQRKMARAFNLPMVWGTDANLDGRSLSVARDAGIPAIYTEIGGAGIYRDEMMEVTVTGCLNLLRTFGFVPGIPTKSDVSHHVEDFQQNSGHLQSLYPSPSAGFYLPDVQLGQHVTKGDVVGRITLNSSLAQKLVYAEEDGMVFLLRSTPSVGKGDTLMAILPAKESSDQIQSIR